MSSDSESDLHSDEGQQQGDWGDWSGGEEADSDACKSLLSDIVLPSPELALAHDAAHCGFDLLRFRRQHQLDDYETIRVINYVRRQVAAGQDPLPALAAATASSRPWADDAYLNPALPDDPLLSYDYEVEAIDAEADYHQAGQSHDTCMGPSSSQGTDSSSMAVRLAALQAENNALRARLDEALRLSLPEELRAELAGEEAPTDVSKSAGASAAPTGPEERVRAAPFTSAAAAPELQASRSGVGTELLVQRALGQVAAHIDAQYFESYSHFDIHQEMLGDKARTEAYQAALERNPALIRGARVLDVGCGTGILSMFAARSGAAAVVALDGSERIAAFATRNAAANGLGADAGGPIHVVASKVEEVCEAGRGGSALLGSGQVDVIVSEWMGYALLFESMLDSVLHARDRWLRPGGAVLPNMATVHVAGAGEGALGADFWRHLYGFSMDAVADDIRRAAQGRVLVREVAADMVATTSVQLHAMDLVIMSPSDQDFSAPFELRALPGSGPGGGVEVCALVLWFTTEFSARFCTEAPVLLSTAPDAAPTHWGQAVLALRTPVQLSVQGAPDTAQALTGRLSMARSRVKHRCLDISLEYGAQLGDGRQLQEVQSYSMGVTDPE